MKPAEIIAQKLIDAITKGVSPWARPWRTSGQPAPRNGISKRGYRGINFFILAMSGYDSPNWFTFKSLAPVGATVRKGEKGTPVALWVFPDKEKKAAAKKAGKAEPRPWLKYYVVFNERQIENLPANLQWVPPVVTEGTKGKEIAEAEAVLKWWSDEQCPMTWGGSNRAFYRPSTDTITMPKRDQFESFDGMYHTAFHECAHSTGHKDRLNRDLSGEFGSKLYAQEELVAELTASLCGQFFCFDVAGNDAAYVKSWVSKLEGDANEIMKAASKAQKAFDLLIGAKPEENAEPEEIEAAA